MKPAYWIKKLRLRPHPEGGYYRETYRSRASTVIYFLLKSGEISFLHRLKSDEIWHFYAGSPLVLSVIHPDGRLETLRLGKEQMFQAVVPAGSWFGGWVAEPDSFALTGCAVAPPFRFRDFELGKRNFLIRKYPAHKKVIEKLTAWKD